MEEICPKIDCTGCKTCSLKCPKQCISFREDDKGHIYPIIHQDICINCGLCKKVCPVLHPIELHPIPEKVFASWIKDNKNRLISTSGGLSYLLSYYIVKNGGVFYGVDWDSEVQDVAHYRCDDIKELKRFQGSKYGHSDVRDTYKEVLKDLKEGKNVLYSGTPCQIAGLKSFLGKTS